MLTILVNVGNTRCAAALAEGTRILSVARMPTDGCCADAAAGLLRRVTGGRPAGASVLASVVPGVTGLWVRALRRVAGRAPVQVGSRCRLNVALRYPRPRTLGADRIAHVCGAVHLCGAPVIVCDFGTAAVFDAVMPDGAFIGGVIAPGPTLMCDALANRTALLPQIRPAGPVGPVGRSTVQAMRIGVRVGYRGAVREILAHLRRLPGMASCPVCVTGGAGRQVAGEAGLRARIVPELTLLGLAVIGELNGGES